MCCIHWPSGKGENVPNRIAAGIDDRCRYAVSRFVFKGYEANHHSDGFVAHLLPTIIGIKCKLEQSTDRLVQPLVKALSDGINRRFHAVLTDKEHLIASILHPQFKLNFLQEDARLNMKRMVLAYIQEVADECHEAESDASQALSTTGISISSS